MAGRPKGELKKAIEVSVPMALYEELLKEAEGKSVASYILELIVARHDLPPTPALVQNPGPAPVPVGTYIDGKQRVQGTDLKARQGTRFAVQPFKPSVGT